MRLSLTLLGVTLLGALIAFVGCGAQRWEHFTEAVPLKPEATLIIGFHGGRDAWNNERVGVGRMATRLRALELPMTHIQTVENTRRALALRFVRAALDRNQDGNFDEGERKAARIILYGESFGGAAVVKFARQLEELDVPVLLTVQVDSVGRGDEVIPANVAAAANLYQRSGRIIRGPESIRAESPKRTRILGNFRYDYRDSDIDISDLPWYKTILRNDHARMDRDPKVWKQVEELILNAAKREPPASQSRSITAQ
jgi:hypothetical protein